MLRQRDGTGDGSGDGTAHRITARDGCESASGQEPSPSGRRREIAAVTGLAVFVAVVILGFLLHDLRGSVSFALELRARKVAAMSLVGVSLGTATVLFHTISGNRILTPSLMGFDALYVLVQTAAALVLGTFVFLGIDARIRFGFEIVVMVGFALLLNRLLLSRARGDLVGLLLVGVVMGGMFRSLSGLVGRLIDPNEFVTLQDRFFASFATVDEDLLVISVVVVVAVLAVVWRYAAMLDVMALGRDSAVGLGVDHRRVADRSLMGVAVLVSVATALVGPITFLGLLAANLGYRLTGSLRHRWNLAAAALGGAGMLVGAQFVIERWLGFETRAGIVIGFVGGLTFIVLLLQEART